ncbi:hypothetical protein O6H91_16G033100 [Diphasiastrum complanatum]|uniref:Uncharacterized protein n=1 Tax=Diphasiastrum complanatum TaxID=34168 RepID=A0ACC2BB79_DIPCM|nr:hypothetical protein O6H91_16G033100 [Diphasiastrum complanatum]
MAGFYGFYDDAAKYYDSAYSDPFWCSECDELLCSTAEFFFHQADHLRCVGCDKKFKSNAALQKHFSESAKCFNWIGRSMGGSSSYLDDEEKSDEDDEGSKKGLDGDRGSIGLGLHKACDGDEFHCFRCSKGFPYSDLAQHVKSHLEDDVSANTDEGSKCSRCKLQFETTEALQEHFSKSRVHKVCSKCRLDLPSQLALNDHCRVFHPRNSALKVENVDIVCFLCSKCIDKQDGLDEHYRRKHFRCFPCEREFVNAKALFDHLSSSARHHYCNVCDTDFLSADSLMQHGKSHRNKKPDGTSHHNKEPDAMSYYNEPDVTSQHIKLLYGMSHNNKELDELLYRYCDDYSCIECLEEFDTLLDKQWHEYDSHVSCVVCPKQFASKKAYIDHLTTYGGQPYCWECNDYYPFRDQRVEHRLMVRLETEGNQRWFMSDAGVKKKVYVCDECDENENLFNSVEELESHLSTNHFRCRKCDKDFSSKQALTEHTRTSSRHSYCKICRGGKPFHKE